jgi:hypothetical protein
MKKETLEEAAERYGQRLFFNNEVDAKWQAERMYSEEDLREAFHVGRLYQGREGDTNFEKWFEQFKNK